MISLYHIPYLTVVFRLLLFRIKLILFVVIRNEDTKLRREFLTLNFILFSLFSSIPFLFFRSFPLSLFPYPIPFLSSLALDTRLFASGDTFSLFVSLVIRSYILLSIPSYLLFTLHMLYSLPSLIRIVLMVCQMYADTPSSVSYFPPV